MKPIRVLVAPDAYKSSLPAAAAASHLATGLKSPGGPACEVLQCPIADGGEGTIAVLAGLGAVIRRTTVTGPLGEPVAASWASLNGTAYVEVAQGAGAHHVTVRNAETCLRASSAGVGQLLVAALDAGYRRIVLTTGGSSVSDGGAGMLAALGARFGPPNAALGGGGSLSRLGAVDLSGLDRRFHETDMVVAVDVDNPLLGADGAARTFAAQKGAGPEEIELLERGLAHWADLLVPAGLQKAGQPGAGASGGIGFAAQAVLGARRVSGADLVLDLLGVEELLANVDLVVTGEGSLDSQSLSGKAPLALARRAARRQIPVMTVAGRVELGPPELREHGIRASWSLVQLSGSTASALAEPGRWLEEAGRRIASCAPHFCGLTR
ncbi:glycerate kinase [bacterium RCC_150]